MLARALLKKPKILFLDEPTSALDVNASIEILSICEDLIKTQNISVVAILHDLNLASLFCNKLIFLKNGIIKYKGFVNELLKEEIIKDIYGINCEIIAKEPMINLDVMFSVSGILRDVDDEWLELECTVKKKKVLKIFRIDNVSSVNELGEL